MSERELVEALLAEAAPSPGREAAIGPPRAAALLAGELLRRHGRITVSWLEGDTGEQRAIELVLPPR